MDKAEHGKRLKAAMASRAIGREQIADAADVKVRTVTNWTSGSTMPSDKERASLRRLLGPYDEPGDPVEVALGQSELVEWRRDAVRSFYKRNLFEQRERGTG
jgi:transcriptional regulator with XRE-family HTH domain